jgi:hypothetical protein
VMPLCRLSEAKGPRACSTVQSSFDEILRQAQDDKIQGWQK